MPEKLSTADARAGIVPTVGDIPFYALRGNLAIFPRDFVYSHGLVRLGKPDSGIDELRHAGAVKAWIEMVQDS